MTVKPILFSAVMVRALLEGRKTQTRRLLKCAVPPRPALSNVKGEPKHDEPYLDAYCGERKTAANPRGMGQLWTWWTRDNRPGAPFKVGYAPGDLLWVRETWARVGDNEDDIHGCPDLRRHVYYRADHVPGPPLKWRVSIHMPRGASRLTLEVTDVRVERLVGITDEDALAEGVTKVRDHCYVVRGFDYDTAGLCHTSPVTPFAKLWRHINGDDAWDANTWVIVLTFTVHKWNVDELLRQREPA